MARFTYQAIELATGRYRNGVIEGGDNAAAASSLKARGLVPTRLTPETGSASGVTGGYRPQRAGDRARAFSRSPSRRQLAEFTRQLAMLVKAGLPLVRALEVVARQERSPAFAEVLANLVEAIRAGGTFSDGLERYPRIFDRLYINMIRAGESGGVLDVVLLRLAQFQEKNIQVRGRIKAALTYPAIIIIVAGLIVLALMTFVVPKFEVIFAGALKGQALPALTQLVLAGSNLIKTQALPLAGAMLVLGGVLKFAIRSTRVQRWLDWAKLRLPLFGDLWRKAAIARFARTLGTLLASGVPILQSLVIARDTSGNAHLSEGIQTVHDRVKAGEGVAGPLRATGIFPDMVPSMIEVGEETGGLPDMLARVADNYDEEVDQAVTALTSLIEPLMIVMMAVMVGTIVLALFLPIIRIVQNLG